MQLPKLSRPLALALGVGTLASAWAWTSQFWCRTTHQLRTEPASARKYRVITRHDHDPHKPAPVLFVLHAYATAPDIVLRSYSLETLAVRARGFILVVPEGLIDSVGNPFWNASRACCGEGPARPDDLGYLRGVLQHLKQDYAVDRGQMLAFGVSNGGFMAYRWACSAGAELTAIASIAGAALGPEDVPCTPWAPISVLQVHGDADDVVQYAGGSMRSSPHPSARDSLVPFLHAAQLGQQQPTTERTRTLFYGTIRKEHWSGKDASIALWTVEGRGHQLRAAQACVPDILDFLQGSRRGRQSKRPHK